MTRLAALLVFVALTGAAWAQAPSDRVTVTSERQRQVISSFVAKLTAPTRITGKLARWEAGVCPAVLGLRDEFGKFIAQRLRDTAARVGAPVNKDADCRPNVHITFTTTPQALITNIRNTQPYMLGYADSQASKDQLAKVTLPIQAWYTTQSHDLRGRTIFDNPKPTHDGRDIIPGMVLPNVLAAWEVTGGRLSEGTRTTFYNVIIVADPNALLDHEMGTVADHVAMLTLAQTDPLKDCPPLPSILNLFTLDCATQPIAMTVNDEGYLRGLYSMDAQAILRVQHDQLVHEIGKTLEGQ